MILLRKQNLKTSVPQTILWKKLYILKLESQNVKTFRQEMNSYLCSVFSFSTWKKLRRWKPKPTMRTRGKVRKAVIYHALPSDGLNMVGFPTLQSTYGQRMHVRKQLCIKKRVIDKLIGAVINKCSFSLKNKLTKSHLFSSSIHEVCSVGTERPVPTKKETFLKNISNEKYALMTPKQIHPAPQKLLN